MHDPGNIKDRHGCDITSLLNCSAPYPDIQKSQHILSVSQKGFPIPLLQWGFYETWHQLSHCRYLWIKCSQLFSLGHLSFSWKIHSDSLYYDKECLHGGLSVLAHCTHQGFLCLTCNGLQNLCLHENIRSETSFLCVEFLGSMSVTRWQDLVLVVYYPWWK